MSYRCYIFYPSSGIVYNLVHVELFVAVMFYMYFQCKLIPSYLKRFYKFYRCGNVIVAETVTSFINSIHQTAKQKNQTVLIFNSGWLAKLLYLGFRYVNHLTEDEWSLRLIHHCLPLIAVDHRGATRAPVINRLRDPM